LPEARRGGEDAGARNFFAEAIVGDILVLFSMKSSADRHLENRLTDERTVNTTAHQPTDIAGIFTPSGARQGGFQALTGQTPVSAFR